MDNCIVGKRTTYGKAHWKGRRLGAHRVAWMEVHGEIAHGLHVLHTCDNPPCVNIDHLFLGTAADNCADKMKKGRYRNGWLDGEDCHFSKLKEKDVFEIRRLRERGMMLKDIAIRFGVCLSNVKQIIYRVTWKHV